MSNPSPRDIYQHIDHRNSCERASFMDFMNVVSNEGWLWKCPIPDSSLESIKLGHPDWYSWMQEKGLLPRKTVKREGWINIYNRAGERATVGRFIYADKGEAEREALTSSEKIATIKIEWEEPE